MPDEIVLPEQVSQSFLHSLLDSAYMQVEMDADGDVFVKESYRCWLFPQPEGKHIRFLVQLRGNQESSLEDRLRYANAINDRLKLIRAYIDSDGDFGFDYYLAVDGGVTKKNIVFAVKYFLSLVTTAVQEDENNLIA